MKQRKVIVAQRSRVCSICRELNPEAVAIVNAAIWPEPGVALRGRDYRIAAVRAARAGGLDVEAKTITRHAHHVERSWHRVTADHPARPGETPVFPTDYDSIVNQAAQAGAVAMARIQTRIPSMEDRDLISVAKMGTSAVGQRKVLQMRAQEVETAQGVVAALFGLASQHIDLGDMPEVEVIDVTPVEVLQDAVRQEREALKRLAAGEASSAG